MMASKQTKSQVNCTILVVGKSGAGKSTVANAFLDSSTDKFEVGSGFDSVTKSSTLKTSKVTHGKIDYTVHVVDTVGLFEVAKPPAKQPEKQPEKQQLDKHNQKLIEDTKEFIKTQVSEGLSLIVFVMKQGRYTDEEKNTFDQIMANYLNEIKEISALVFTYCESDNDKKRAQIVKNFKENDKTSEIAAFMTKGIFTVGFPDLEGYTDSHVKKYFRKSSEDDKKQLHKLMRESVEMKLPKDVLLRPSFWERCTLL